MFNKEPKLTPGTKRIADVTNHIKNMNKPAFTMQRHSNPVTFFYTPNSPDVKASITVTK